MPHYSIKTKILQVVSVKDILVGLRSRQEVSLLLLLLLLFFFFQIRLTGYN